MSQEIATVVNVHMVCSEDCSVIDPYSCSRFCPVLTLSPNLNSPLCTPCFLPLHTHFNLFPMATFLLWINTLKQTYLKSPR